MISGLTSDINNLYGSVTAKKALTGSISAKENLIGTVSVSVKDVPYYETSNSSGGLTVYIGKEVPNYGL